MTQQPTERDQVAYAIAADDMAVDIPQNPTEREPGGAESFHDYAVRRYGMEAAKFIAMHDALQTARFGPETSPTPFSTQPQADDFNPYAVVDTAPDTAEQFARQVQALIDAHDDDWEIRDEQIVALATKYAAQLLPGGLVYPTVQPPVVDVQLPDPGPVTVAIAGESFRDEFGYYVALLEEGRPGFYQGDGDLSGFTASEGARMAAHYWNERHGVTVEQISRVAAGVQL